MNWRRFLRRDWWDAERAREIEAYLDIETSENIARGMTPADAVTAARRKLGNPALIREDIYRMNTVQWIDSTYQDLRHGLRLLRLNPGFFAVAGLSLVLGIGANTAIFQLLDAVRLRMLPVAHPEQLAELKIAKNDHCCSGMFAARRPNFTYPQWQQIRDHQQSFASVFAWGDRRFNLAGNGEVQYAEGLWVTGEFFQTLGVTPLVGRLIGSDDDRPGCGSPGAVISHAFWQKRFGGDPQVTEKKILLEGRHFPVLGVTPASFSGVEVGRNFDVAVPACAEPLIDSEDSYIPQRDHWWLAIMGRLKPGFSVDQATAQVAAMSPAVFESTVPPKYRPEEVKYYAAYKLSAVPAGSGVSSLRGDYEKPLYLLLAIAGLVLVIACANLANLMLARASTRQREIAVRLAIGAGRGRLIRQMLVESLLLAAAGVVGGVVVSQVLSRYLVSFLNLYLDLHTDWRILAFTAATGVLTCILFGLYPAFYATRIAPADAMKTTGRGLTSNREKFGFRRVLVVSQVSLSLVLLAGALLFVRSLRNLVTLDTGFRENGLLIANVDISRSNYNVERRAAYFRDLLGTVRHAPGVDDVATAAIVPVSGSGWNHTIEILDGPKQGNIVPWFNRITPSYFKTMDTPLLAGRMFDNRDTLASPEVAIVNEEFRKKYLGGANPLGKEFRLVVGPGEPQHVYQIVGLVRNSKYQSLRDNFVPIVFVAADQEKDPGFGVNMIVRSSAPLGSLMPELKRAILSVNPVASIEFKVFKTTLRESILRERLMAILSGFFGFLAAILATAGLYGVISYMVARRRNEIGIRVALGANRANILRLVLREAGVLLVAGLVIGTGLSISAAQTAGSLVYGLQPSDPVTIELAVALLAVVALAASLIPALRASRLNPMAALREE